jgi:DNA polymerase III epsilon subunit-like protein
MKILWIDTETTGFSSTKNALIEISLIFEEDGVITRRYYSQIKPFPDDEIKQDAMDLNQIDIEKITKEPMTAAQEVMLVLLSCTVDKTKLTMGGQNTPFDRRFLLQFLLKCGYSESGFNEIFSDEIIDTRRKAETFFKGRDDAPENMKLETLAKHFGIPLEKAHNAEHDCLATIGVHGALLEAHRES